MTVILFAAAAVSHNFVGNAAATTGHIVTIFGLNFGGTTDRSPTMNIGGTICDTTTWTTQTLVRCMPHVSTGRHVQLLLTNAVIAGTSFSPFTFDGKP